MSVVLGRRVQVLFSDAAYGELEALAREGGCSVSTLIRESVDEMLARGRQSRVAALDRLLASAASDPPDPYLADWQAAKESFDSARPGLESAR
jgi:hypothetical protein